MSELADLFRVGKEITLDVTVGGEDFSFDIWLRKPTVEQQQRARTKANAASVRARRPYKDKESEEYVSLSAAVLEVEDREDLIDMLVEHERSDARNEAYNELLHDEEIGSDWSEEGKDYQGTLTAQAQRMLEVLTHNEDDPEDLINPDEDEELLKLRVIQDEFNEEWAERTETLIKSVRRQFDNTSLEDLREKVIKKSIDLEVLMAFHQEYRMNMLFYACRKPNEKRKFFFDSKEEILEIPFTYQVQLLDEMEALLSADPKASATPQSS